DIQPGGGLPSGLFPRQCRSAVLSGRRLAKGREVPPEVCPQAQELAACAFGREKPMDIPMVAPLRQIHPHPVVADVAGEVRRQWRDSSLPRRLKPGARLAVGIGSRGIANIFTIAKTSIDT